MACTASRRTRMPKVIVHQPVSDLRSSAACPKGVHPLLWQIYRARGVIDPAELEPGEGYVAFLKDVVPAHYPSERILVNWRENRIEAWHAGLQPAR